MHGTENVGGHGFDPKDDGARRELFNIAGKSDIWLWRLCHGRGGHNNIRAMASNLLFFGQRLVVFGQRLVVSIFVIVPSLDSLQHAAS